MLAGPFDRENLLSYGIGKVDENELAFVEKVILAALVDDPHKIVPGRPGIGNDPVNFAEDQ